MLQGAVTGPLERDPWGGFRYVRIGGATPFDDDRFSSLKDTVLFPTYKKHEAVWPSPTPGGPSRRWAAATCAASS